MGHFRRAVSADSFDVKFYADKARHLVCVPYSIENLHAMAEELGIKRCWFHTASYPHYDIPKKRVVEILEDERVEVVSSREILAICKGWRG